VGIGERNRKRFDGDVEVTRLSRLTQPARIAALCESLPPRDREGLARAIEAVVGPRIVRRQSPGTTMPRAVPDEGLDLMRTVSTDGGADVMPMQRHDAPASPFDLTGTQKAALAIAWLVLQCQPLSSPSNAYLTPKRKLPVGS
jgi:hypothetical protein